MVSLKQNVGPAVVYGGDPFIASVLVRRLESARVPVCLIGNRDSGPQGREADPTTVNLPADAVTDGLERDVLNAAPTIAFIVMPREIENPDDPGAAVSLETVLRTVNACGRAGCRYLIGLGSSDEVSVLPTAAGDLQAMPRATALIGLTVGLTVTESVRSWGGTSAWLRLPEVYGPTARTGTVADIIRAMMFNTPLVLDVGSESLELLYVDDVVDAVLAAASVALTGTYAVSPASGVTQREVADIVQRAAGVTEPLRPRFAERGRSRSQRLDPGPFQEATGWMPTTDLSTGIARTVAWYRDPARRFT